MEKAFFKLSVISILVLGLFTAAGGTLDSAPFRVVLPDASWTLNDSTAQNMGKGVYLVASITSTNTRSKSIIIKTVIEGSPASPLDEICAGIRDQFSDPIVKKLSDEEATFLGYKARRFTYAVKGTTYNEAIVFVSGNTGWTIACVGLLDQKTEIKNLLSFYQKKGR